MCGIVGVIAATPVTDTVKQAGDTGEVERTLDRSGLWAVQTPQAFRADALRDALAQTGNISSAIELARAIGGDYARRPYAIRDGHLWVERCDVVELAPDRVISTIGYNGTSPGPRLRMKDAAPVRTDNGNLIYDAACGRIEEPATLARQAGGKAQRM